MSYDLIVDGQSLNQLVTILDVKREMGKPEKDRIIKVEVIIKQDVMATIDVLNKILTGDLQEFIFTDQPDRYWEGKVLGGITPSSSERWSKFTFEIEVPDGVAYAVEPVELDLGQTSVLSLENKGTEITYPVIDFKMNSRTYMVSAMNEDDVFQFGEAWDSAPMKEYKTTRYEVKNTPGFWTKAPQVMVNDYWKNLKTETYDISKVTPRWTLSGRYVADSAYSTVVNVGSSVTISNSATHWQTGERMANWVKGKSFQVAQVKNVNQSASKKAYLLKNRGVYIGWLLEQDVAGAKKTTYTDMEATFGSGANWHGPAIRYKIDGTCSNWEAKTTHWFLKKHAGQYGAFYFAVMNYDKVLASIAFSAHQYNFNTRIDFYANGRGVDIGNYDLRFATNYYGHTSIIKNGNRYTFEVKEGRMHAGRTFPSITRSYTLPATSDTPTHILVWSGKNSTNYPIENNTICKLYFKGNDTNVWVAPKTEQVKVVDVNRYRAPEHIFNTGDVVRLDMRDNTAYVNGMQSLSPIAFGSDNVGLKVGKQEILVPSDHSGSPPSVSVHYREVFR